MYLLKGNSDPNQTKTVTMTGHDAGLDKLRQASGYNQAIADQNDASKTQFTFAVDKSKLAAGQTVNIGGKDYTIIKQGTGAGEYAAYDKNTKSGVMNNGVLAQDDTKITGARAEALIQQALSQANYIGDKDKTTKDGDATLVDAADTTNGAKATLKTGNIKDGFADGEVDLTAEAAGKTFKIDKAQSEIQQALNFNLHVGADADMNNKIGVGIEAMNSKYLGVDKLDVVGKDSAGNNKDDGGIAATYAIDAIADAVAKVSAQRSSLGAVQNRLEHTINNVDNVVENTTSAESRIRDTDMADEMVTYSKNNILAQAGQSMLAQANQSTQGVLSLLG